MDFKNICINCMKEKAEGESVCQHCGFDSQTYVIPQYVLPPHTILNGKYLLGKVLGMGGFGITYMALDLMLEHPVAIKEYFIQNIMYRNVAESSHITIACSDIPNEKIYKISREKFENEAKTLASLSDLPGIVRVLDFFTEFNTAYIVMEYLSGMTLKEYVKEQGGKLSVKETREKLNPIMTSLQYVHDRNIIHRDISPDNMKVLDKGIASGTVKLFDFGGAGQEIRSEDDPKSAIVLKKDGYTPIEQIAGASNQGAWTDVYAMAATIYFCICGQPPLSANARVAEPDKFKTPTQLGVPIGKKVEEVLLKAMSIQTGQRYQTMKEFQDALEKAGWGETPKHTIKVWPFMATGCVAAVVCIIFFINKAQRNPGQTGNILEVSVETQKEEAERLTEAQTIQFTEKDAETQTEQLLEKVTEIGTDRITENSIETETEQVTEKISETEENATSLFKLGRQYHIGDGVEQNFGKALEYYEKAAELGSANAMNNLGYMYKNGEGIEQNYEKALEYYKKAAELGSANAMNNLGCMYEKGDGVNQNYEKALEYYKKAAEEDLSIALYNLGRMYEKGKGTEQSYEKALEYYERAATYGDPDALKRIDYIKKTNE